VQDNFLGCDSSNFTKYSISWSIETFLALINEHLNFTKRVMNMPRYLIVSTQGIMWPEAVVILLHSTLWVKKHTPYSCRSLREKLIDFQDSFTDRLITIFSTKYVSYSSPYLTDVAVLPCETAMFQKSYKLKNTFTIAVLLCETAMFQKSYKLKNTLSKDVVLKYFCRCTFLISFFRQIRVSIKNYKISVRLKYSVRDLIYDIHICAWAAMAQ